MTTADWDSFEIDGEEIEVKTNVDNDKENGKKDHRM